MRSLLCLLIFASIASAQMRVSLHNGSVLVGSSELKTLTLQTAYGDLKIPIEDVRSVTFGLHYPDGVQDDVTYQITKLESNIYAEREKATAVLLKHGKYSLNALSKAKGSSEVKTRASEIMKKILEANPTIKELQEDDLIRTKRFDVRGNLMFKEFSIQHDDYTSVKFLIHTMSDIRFAGRADEKHEVKAEKKWYSTKLDLEVGEKLRITASGQVELWPQAPGQNVCGPNGKKENPHKGFLAGALIGKIGKGEPFLIGESFNTVVKDSGILQLYIIESPWNNVSEGSYQVHIRQGD